MRTILRPSFLSLMLLPAACGGGKSSSTGPTDTGYPQQPPAGNPVTTATVQVTNNAFSPASVSLSSGGSVTWTWVGSGHSVTSDGQPSFTPNAPVVSAPYTLGPVVFASPGTYQYYCTVHGVSGGYGGGMLGTIFVQ